MTVARETRYFLFAIALMLAGLAMSMDFDAAGKIPSGSPLYHNASLGISIWLSSDEPQTIRQADSGSVTGTTSSDGVMSSPGHDFGLVTGGLGMSAQTTATSQQSLPERSRFRRWPETEAEAATGRAFESDGFAWD